MSEKGESGKWVVDDKRLVTDWCCDVDRSLK